MVVPGRISSTPGMPMFTVAVIAKISRPSDSTRVAASIPRQGLPMLIAPRQIKQSVTLRSVPARHEPG